MLFNKNVFLIIKYILLIIIFNLMLIIFISSTNEKELNNENTNETDQPIILSINPKEAYTGNTITILGKNFNNERNNSTVQVGDISCKYFDFDYLSWSNDIIKIKVPTGAKSDKIIIKIGDKIINGPEVKIKNNTHIYTNPIDITIDYELNISSFSYDTDKKLYFWIPSAIPSAEQKNLKLIKIIGNHIERQTDELDLFKVDKINTKQSYSIGKIFSFTNYQLETKINPEDVTYEYDCNSEFYKYYTSPDQCIESTNPRIINQARQIINEEKNPYLKAKLIYDWIVNYMSYQYPPPNRRWNALQALDTHRGDCAVYSFLFTALCHASGIPARPIAGHVLLKNDIISMHFWAEFYLPDIGWIPVDVNYGDTQIEGFMSKEFYFGNLDNKHIAFSKGRVIINLSKELTGNKEKAITLLHLQKYFDYMQGKPKNFKYNITRLIKRVS